MWSQHQYSDIKPDKMNRKFILSLLTAILLNGAAIYSQNSDLPQSLSYDQAVSYAMQNNPDLKIQELNYLISIEKLNESKLSLVPQIYGRYDIQGNLIIPSTLVPVGKFNPSLPEDELVPIKFGTNWSSGIGLVASVKLFDPQIIGDIREKKASLSLSDIDRKITLIDIEIEAGKAYVNCLLSDQQIRFAEDDTANSYRELAETELKYKAGFLKLTDLNQTILNHRNAVSRYKEAARISYDSKQTLFFWMGLANDSNRSFVLTDTLEILINRFLHETGDYSEVTSSLTLGRLSVLNNIEKVRLKNAKTGFMPVISLNGIYGTDFYNNKLILGDENFWFGNSNINLSLRMPITEGISRIKKIAQQKYLIDINREEINAALNKKELEKNKTKMDIEFYRTETVIKRSNLDLAKANYNAAFSQFKEGKILQSELLQAELSYKQVKIEYLKALYGYLDSLLNFKRTILS